MAKEKKVEQITDMEVDFAQWFTDVCIKAELVDYSDVKGRIAAEKCISGLTAHHSCNIICKLEMLFQNAIEPLGGDHLSTDRVTWRRSAACLA